MDLSLSRSFQQHVGDDGNADSLAMVVGDIHLADTDPGTDPQQVSARQQTSFRDRTEIIDLQLYRSKAAFSFEAVVERTTHGGIGEARGNAAMQGAGAVHQFRAQSAANGETILVNAHQFEPEQAIKAVPV